MFFSEESRSEFLCDVVFWEQQLSLFTLDDALLELLSKESFL